MSIHWYIHQDAQEASRACARRVLDRLAEAVSARAHASLAVSGGSTPKLLFAELAQSQFDWSKVHLFWVDERAVPPADSQSNYRLAKEHFIDPARFPAANVHRIQAELDPQTAARLYIEEIRRVLAVAPGKLPHFDIVHQGMGPDAHTASLFPGGPLIDDRENVAAAAYVEKFHQWRITLLPAVLLAALNTVMLVAGADKAEALRAVVREPYDPKKYPAQLMTQPGHNVMWFLDKAAARLVE